MFGWSPHSFIRPGTSPHRSTVSLRQILCFLVSDLSFDILHCLGHFPTKFGSRFQRCLQFEATLFVFGILALLLGLLDKLADRLRWFSCHVTTLGFRLRASH
ncbi:hypothetical protein PV04_00956 [Phialophora macrospora]|uniref:Uncharacterized protein n=1 Tax=Phialophora macrospora TaxID=1851006 RepID=A0A0D2D593_9EURO|nr:hypothetical protein PV04_00956 [Phialophora macrospora]